MRYFYEGKIIDYSIFDGPLSGFAQRNLNYEVLGGPESYTKILWIKNLKTNLIFISIDILYIPIDLTSKIYDYFENKFSIDRSEIVFNATHTHSTPGIEKKFNTIIDENIIKVLFENIIYLIDKSTFEEGFVSFESFESTNDMWISRRKIGRDIKKMFLKNSMLMLPNNKNVIDKDIRLICLYDKNKNLVHICYNFSCHPVFNTSNNISSDFIGEIDKKIKQKLKISSVFLQGFSGDIRPNFTTTDYRKVDYVNKAKLFFNKEVFRKYDKNDFDLFCEKVYNEIIKNIHSSKLIDNFEIRKKICHYKLSSESAKSVVVLEIKLIIIENNIFLSIPAEVNSKYYVELKKEFQHFNIFPIGLGDDIIGYLPFFDEVKEGGYEVTSITNYGFDTNISQSSLEEFYSLLKDDIVSLIEG